MPPASRRVIAVLTFLSGLLSATPAFAASPSPGIEAWSTLVVFAALVVMACVMVRNGIQPGALVGRRPLAEEPAGPAEPDLQE
ncbi:MAG: hypothetical protein ABI920_19680 [Casimicrobiaceae bacterium]